MVWGRQHQRRHTADTTQARATPSTESAAPLNTLKRVIVLVQRIQPALQWLGRQAGTQTYSVAVAVAAANICSTLLRR